MRLTPITKWLCGAALLAGLSTPVFAAPALKTSAAETKDDLRYRSCTTLTVCVGLLERHDSESFDYAVLARDFDYFGDKGRAVLWRLVGSAVDSRDESAIQLANRALDMLSRSGRILSPADQRRTVGLWRAADSHSFEPKHLGRIMMNNLSPMVRSSAVQTLGSPNSDIARLSRVMIDQSLRRKMDFPMPAADFAPLRTALLTSPSPMLVALMDEYDPKQSAPVFAKLLRSGETPAVIAAYAALYRENPEEAFKALVATLYDLGPKDSQAALGIAALLVHRHPLREDGFYMTFASELANDKEMSAAGRLAGFDALLRLQDERGTPAVKDTPMTRGSFTRALKTYSPDDIPPAYFSLPLRLKTKTPDVWLAPLQAAATSPKSQLALTETAGQYDNNAARNIAVSAFKVQNDYAIKAAGILAVAAQSGPDNQMLAQEFETLSRSHEMTLVRAAAQIGRLAALSKSPRQTVLKKQGEITKLASTVEPRSAFCRVTPTNLRALARPMPFYNPAVLPSGLGAERQWLTSGARHASGWLAGYSRPGSGGLVSYQNTSGEGLELFGGSAFGPQAVLAVQPVGLVKLGETAREFWVIASGLRSGESAAYRLSQTRESYSSEASFTLTRHQLLPSLPTAIRIETTGEITMAFGRVNPPLTLGHDGLLRRSCEPQSGRIKNPS